MPNRTLQLLKLERPPGNVDWLTGIAWSEWTTVPGTSEASAHLAISDAAGRTWYYTVTQFCTAAARAAQQAKDDAPPEDDSDLDGDEGTFDTEDDEAELGMIMGKPVCIGVDDKRIVTQMQWIVQEDEVSVFLGTSWGRWLMYAVLRTIAHLGLHQVGHGQLCQSCLGGRGLGRLE